MRFHLPVRDDDVMDPEPARYVIRINGHLGATVLSAFPAMASRLQGAETVLTGLLDRSALYGVLAEVEALGLDLLEVRQLGRLTCRGKGVSSCSNSRVPRRHRRTREGLGRTDVDVRL